jgi:hypothetical protein
MKQPYKKGVAPHLGPESCANDRKAVGEALTGGHAGQPSSSEITTPACRPGPDKGKATPGAALSEPFLDAAESKTLSMRGSSLRENRETSGTPVPWGAGRSGKAASRTPDMHVLEESDDLVVPTKRANKAGQAAAAESVEGRGSTKGNSCPLATRRTPCRRPRVDLAGRDTGRRLVRRPRSTQGKSRRRQFLVYGSVRGAPGNGRPYRDRSFSRKKTSRHLYFS